MTLLGAAHRQSAGVPQHSQRLALPQPEGQCHQTSGTVGQVVGGSRSCLASGFDNTLLVAAASHLHDLSVGVQADYAPAGQSPGQRLAAHRDLAW